MNIISVEIMKSPSNSFTSQHFELHVVSPRTPHAGGLFVGLVHSELWCGLYSFLSGLLHLNLMFESIWVAA